MKILFAVYFSNFSCPNHFNDFRNFLGGTTQHTHCGNIYEWLIQKRIFLNRGEMQEVHLHSMSSLNRKYQTKTDQKLKIILVRHT